ncbi:zinc ribbon domain-containing protein [Chloroflexi bacterium TSY]|nr:zinc ribbon domain-containing protein [Chloroflexi bacterium TSY]
MIGGGKIVGWALMIGSVVLLLAFLAWASTALFTEETTSGGAVLGILLALIVLAPVFGIGVYVMRRGTDEERQFAVVQQEKKLLNMVLTQGQVSIGELIAELEEPRENIEEMIRDLVGKRLFSGAINWDKGILYSVESQNLVNDRHCPNCGGELEFAGKGLIACPYCGSEVFLTNRAAASTVEG